MKHSKSELRKVFREYRNAYSAQTWGHISTRIQEYTYQLIQDLDLRKVGCYIESTKTRELSTKKLIKWLLTAEYELAVPVVTEDYSMVMSRINNEPEFQNNQWGIPEPIQLDIMIKPEILIIPMLGADMKGYRLGYGKGYYDRYLSKLDTVKIGVCPNSCIVEQLPVDEYDIPLDYLITENGIIRKNEN